MQIYLNRFISKIVTHLQHNYVRRHKLNSEFRTTSAENYMEKVFTDGEYLHATIKE